MRQRLHRTLPAATPTSLSGSAFSQNAQLRNPCRHSRHLTGYKFRTTQAPQLPPRRPRGSPASQTCPPGHPGQPTHEQHRARSALSPRAPRGGKQSGLTRGLKHASRLHKGALFGACWGKRHSGFLSLENWHLRIEILQMEFSSDKVSCFSKQFLMAYWVSLPNGVITLMVLIIT